MNDDVAVSQSASIIGMPSTVTRFEASQHGQVWLTPGSYIASRVSVVPEVRLVLERLDNDRYSVFVVLEDDPEEVLDAIISAEQQLYSLYRAFPFDVRIMNPNEGWSDEDLKASSIRYYERR